MALKAKKIILASKSARRRELLEQIGVKFEVVAKDTGEDTDITQPDKLVLELARRKLAAIDENGDGTLVIAADTVVWCGGEIMGKPADIGDARRMICKMSGNTHEVYTGIAVRYEGKTAADSVCTRVHFRSLSEEEIDRYVTECEVLDKAGAYGIQERPALFVSGIEGDYFNIVGLPLFRLGTLIKDSFGLELI